MFFFIYHTNLNIFAQWNGLQDKSAEEVFKYASLNINDDGTVTVSLTNNSFNDTEKGKLAALSNTLSGTLRGYRDGKMYYTYKIIHEPNNDPALIKYGVVRNNAYTLKLQNSSIPGIGRATP